MSYYKNNFYKTLIILSTIINLNLKKKYNEDLYERLKKYYTCYEKKYNTKDVFKKRLKTYSSFHTLLIIKYSLYKYFF